MTRRMVHLLSAAALCLSPLCGSFLAVSARTAFAQGIESIDPGNDPTLNRAPTGGPAQHDSGALPDPSAQSDDEKGKDKDTKSPPPTLPGSHAQSTPVAPADKTVADLNPNSALFDAINRGDTVAARDALSRGADPEAHNVLGLTPIELSVDLGRNDISFLLLSLRGSSPEPAAKAVRVAVAAPHAPASRATTLHAAARHPASTTDPRKTVTASSPGSAVASGFLGFGSGGS